MIWRTKGLRVPVENISSSGAMIRFLGPLDVGEEVHLEFDGCAALTGTVKWVKDGRVGIGLEPEAIDIQLLP